MSPKVKTGLLVATHIIAGLLLAWVASFTEVALYGLFALTFADAGLVGVWAGLATTRLAWRLPAVLSGILYVWGIVQLREILDSQAFNDLEGQVLLILIIALITVTIAVVLSRLRRSQRKLRLGHLAEALPLSEGFQFSIRHLLIATAVVAAVLGLGRAVRAFSEAGVFVIGVLPPCLILVEVATLWAALGIGRPPARLAVVLPAAFVVGAIPIFYFRIPAEQSLHFIICIGLSAVITAASLLVVRSCGWRLVSGGGHVKEQGLA